MIPETLTAVVPLICTGVFILAGALIYSLCKISASADAHIEKLQNDLNQEHGVQNHDQSAS